MPTKIQNKRKSSMSRQEAGRKGAEARWGKAPAKKGYASSRSSNYESQRGYGAKSQGTIGRQEAGKRGTPAAPRRGRQEGSERYFDYEGSRGSGNRPQRNWGHEEHGRRGAESQWGRHPGSHYNEGNFENRPSRASRGNMRSEYDEGFGNGRQRRMSRESEGRRGYDYDEGNQDRNYQFNYGRERRPNYEMEENWYPRRRYESEYDETDYEQISKRWER